jgi:Tol biopolymer transport system component
LADPARPAGKRGFQRVSVDRAGTQANGRSYSSSISADGRFVAFGSLARNLIANDTNGRSDRNLIANDTNGRSDIFVHDRLTGAIERVSVDSSGTEANNHSYQPSISAGWSLRGIRLRCHEPDRRRHQRLPRPDLRSH